MTDSGRLIFGYHPVREALRHHPRLVEKVLVCKSPPNRRRRELEEVCQRHSIRVEQVSDSELSRRVLGVHNGFAAELSTVEVGDIGGTQDEDLVVLLEDVLVLEEKQRDHIEALETQIQNARRALDEAREQYRKGIADYLPVLTQLLSVQRLERDLIEKRAQLLLDRVGLYRALGGTRIQESNSGEG